MFLKTFVLILTFLLVQLIRITSTDAQLEETWIRYPANEELGLSYLTSASRNESRSPVFRVIQSPHRTQRLVRFVSKIFGGEEALRKIFPLKWEKISHPLLCQACSAAFALSRRIITSVAVLKEVIAGVCQVVIRNRNECTGIANLYAPAVFHIIKHSNLTSEEMTSVLLDSKCMSRKRFAKSKLNWEVTLPPHNHDHPKNHVKVAKIPDAKDQRGGLKTKFLHVTDAHLDLRYSGGEDVDCSFSLCCRCNDQSASAVGSLNRGSEAKSGNWGSLEGSCDCPHSLSLSTLKAINDTISRETQLSPSISSFGSSELSQSKQLEFVIWTGDITPHDVWATTREELMTTASEWTRLMKKFLLNTGIPIFPVLGNHEAVPVNMFAPPGVTVASSQWIYELFYQMWEDWFNVIDSRYGGNANQSFRSTGSYSFNISAKIRVVVLNTVYSSRKNFWNLFQPQDLGNQLSFLVSELAQAESRQQSVHIIGHNPPNSECTDSWLHNYIRIMARFKNVIVGSFYGHTHRDQFYLYSNASATPAGDDEAYATAFVSGSVTPYGHVNPSYKIYTMEKDTAAILDQETFYADIAVANLKNLPPNWQSLYSSRNAYGVEDLSTAEMQRLFEQLSQDPVKRDKYLEFLHRKSNSSFWRDFRDKSKHDIVQGIRVISPLQP